MKIRVYTTVAAAAALALSLSACATMGPESASNGLAKGASKADATARLNTLKEVNRHIELCHRTYTIGWPFSGLVDCPAANQGALSPEAQAAIGAAVAKAVADYAAAHPAAPTVLPVR